MIQTSKIPQRLARLATRHTLWVLLVAVALTAASLAAVRSLRVQTNLVTLLPASAPAVENLRRITEKTGGFGHLIVLAEGGDPGAAARYFAALLPEVRKLSWVRYADYRVRTAPPKSFAALYMDTADLRKVQDRLERHLEHAGGFSLQDKPPPNLAFDDLVDRYERRRKRTPKHRLYKSKDGRLAALRIVPKGSVSTDLAFGRRVQGDVQRLVKRQRPLARKLGLQVTVAGKFYNRLQDYRAVMADVRRSAFWGALLILLLITVYFRHWLAFPLLALPLGMSLSWTFALTRVTLGELNIITAFLFVILLGLGIDFGIHLLSRYRIERRRGRSAEAALTTTFRFTGRACLTSALTTSAAFLALMVTDFKGFSEFGFIAGVGVLLALLAMLTVLPALLVVAERLGLLRPGKPKEPAVVAHPHSPQRPAYRRWLWLLLILLAAAGLAAWGGLAARTGLAFEYDFEKLNTLPPRVVAVKQKTRQVFPRAGDAAVVLVQDRQQAAALEQAVRRAMGEDPTPTIADVRSILQLRRLLPRDQDRKLQRLRAIQGLLSKRAVQRAVAELPAAQRRRVRALQQTSRRPMTLDDLPDSLRRPFRALPGVRGTLVFIEPTGSLKDARFAARFVADTRRFRTAHRTHHPASEAVVYTETIALLQSDGLLAVAAALLAVLLLLMVDLRSPTRCLLVFLPLAVAVGWMLGVMALWPLKLNMFNMLVLPSILGLGIDNGVHVYHRHVELGPGHTRTALRSVLGPMSATTLTTMLGFGGLISAHQAGLRSIGVLAVIGMALSWLAVTTFLPALLMLVDGRKKRS